MEDLIKSKVIPLLAAMALCTGLPTTTNAAIMLFDYGFNLDGDSSFPLFGDPIPAGIDVSDFNDLTGLGTIDITITGAGAHSFDAFFDHEIDEPINTFFNETGAVSGTPSAGQSWEIDEPGFVSGDIYDNFLVGALDNDIGVSVFGNTIFPDDVSMAMGWDFTLAQSQFALITLALADTSPTSGFFLQHWDPDSNESIYFSGDISIVPVPAAVWLFGSGLIGLVALSRRKARA